MEFMSVKCAIDKYIVVNYSFLCGQWICQCYSTDEFQAIQKSMVKFYSCRYSSVFGALCCSAVHAFVVNILSKSNLLNECFFSTRI